MKALIALTLMLAVPSGDVPTPNPNSGCAARLASPQETLVTPADGPSGFEDLLAGGATLVAADAVSSSEVPSCPLVFSCGGGINTTCVSTGCSTVDTGDTSCQAGSALVQCPDGKTIHVTSCSCLTFQARCCTGPPPNCLCVACNSGSQSVSCQ